MSLQESFFGDTGDLLCLTVVYLACTFTCECHGFLVDLQLSVHDLECHLREVLVGVREVFRCKFHIIGSCVCCFYDVVTVECEIVLCVQLVAYAHIVALHCLLDPVIFVFAAVFGDSYDDFVSVLSYRQFARLLCHFVVLCDVVALCILDNCVSAEFAVISSHVLTLCRVFQSGVFVSLQESFFGDTGDLLYLAVVYLACALTCECECFFLDDQFTFDDLYLYFVSNVFAVFCDLCSSIYSSHITAVFYICAGS